jgi:histone acetyltransferase (RNA polymerase elongator complex component)
VKKSNIPIFIPHKGCPNDCVFCNQRRISGQINMPDMEAVSHRIQEWLAYIREPEHTEIAFFGGSFTGLPIEEMQAYLNLATEFVIQYRLKGIRMSTRPDYVNEEIIEFLSAYPVTAIELGVQSMDDQVLRLSKRNHLSHDVIMAAQLIHQANIELGVQMMVGLPGDTSQKLDRTVNQLIDLEPATVRIYPVIVIEETELSDMYRQGLYLPLTVEKAVEEVAEIMQRFIKRQITVIRVGLHAEEGLTQEGFVAGPYHPAFKELVEDYIVYQSIVCQKEAWEGELRDKIENGSVNEAESHIEHDIKVLGNTKMYQRLIGHKKQNARKLKALGIEIGVNHELENNQLELIYGKSGRLVFSVVL